MTSSYTIPSTTWSMSRECDKKYICPITSCSKRYRKPSSLREHVNSHNNNRPFACPEPNCGKRFLRVCHMNVHRWTHSKIKPLKCEECSKGFTTKQQLSRHQATHKKRNAISTAVSTSDIDDVMNSGMPSKPQEKLLSELCCSYDACEEKFITESALAEHLLDMHIMSMITTENNELEIPSTLNLSPCGQASEAVNAFYEKCEEIYTKDYVPQARSWFNLSCKQVECYDWTASSYAALIEHYDEVHKGVPVSLLQYGFIVNENNTDLPAPLHEEDSRGHH